MQPQPAMLNRKSAVTGGNAFGLDDAEEDGNTNLFNVLLTATWNRAEDDALVNRQALSLLDQCAAAARELGVDHPYIYLNYAGPGHDVIVAGYGAESVGRLRETSRQYDPRGYVPEAGSRGVQVGDLKAPRFHEIGVGVVR